jgi:predicted NAD/FAD-dependent oxidoreductase
MPKPQVQSPSPLRQLARRAALVVTEDFPSPPHPRWLSSLAGDPSVPAVWAVDTACVVPMALVTGRTPSASQAIDRAFKFRQATERAFRERAPVGYESAVRGVVIPDAYEGELGFEPVRVATMGARELAAVVRSRRGTDLAIPPASHTEGGSAAGYARWSAFAGGGLRRYAQDRNKAEIGDPHRQGSHAVSRMSSYLHYGSVSPFRLMRDALEAAGGTDALFRSFADEKKNRWGGKGKKGNNNNNNSNNSKGGGGGGVSPAQASAAKFVDELWIWREMSYHFAFHHQGRVAEEAKRRVAALVAAGDEPADLLSAAPKDAIESADHAIPRWAMTTLKEHAGDRRSIAPTYEDLSRAKTGSKLWDLAQLSLVRHGELHNNIRMTWGKGVAAWVSGGPDAALETLVDLNHRYALDGCDPCSYGGLLWCLGQFDRPFSPEVGVLGTVRPRPPADHAKRLPLATYAAHIDTPGTGVHLTATKAGAKRPSSASGGGGNGGKGNASAMDPERRRRLLNGNSDTGPVTTDDLKTRSRVTAGAGEDASSDARRNKAFAQLREIEAMQSKKSRGAATMGMHTSTSSSSSSSSVSANGGAMKSPMHVCVIGAGPAGLSCAAALADQGHAVTVLDKGRRVGGRVATRQSRDAAVPEFDHGVPLLTPARGGYLAKCMESWVRAGVVVKESAVVAGTAGDAPSSGPPLLHDGQTVYRSRAGGMWAVAAHMARGLEKHVRTSVEVAQIETSANAASREHHVVTKDGERLGPYDAVVVAAPAPQAANLLRGYDERAAAAAAKADMSPTLTAMVAYGGDVFQAGVSGSPAAPPRVIYDTTGGVIGKAVRVGDGAGSSAWVAHATTDYSVRHVEDDKEAAGVAIAAALTELLARVPGCTADKGVLSGGPVHVAGHRWRYSHAHDVAEGGGDPIGLGVADCIFVPGKGIAAAGDWAARGSDISGFERAWISGRAAAGSLMMELALAARGGQ